MSGESYAEVWEELGRIDYFLDQLARAVERGEAPLETYDTLAPRYLARREELVAALTGARAVAGEIAGAVAAPAEAHEAAKAASRLVPAVRPSRPHREVRWTQVLAYTGAFLVVIAAAIFTVAVWESVSTSVKLGFLVAFTAVFYGAGALVWRSGLRGGGVALIAVGSAMLLFDGWIAIDGYGLTGPWPWAALLFVLSAVYWFTETRLAGRFFGATGVAAQVGWWWLVGQGLGMDVAPRLAVIAGIAAAWSWASGRAREREEFASLASVLRVAAPVTVAAVVIFALAETTAITEGWAAIASAAVVAASATAVGDRLPVGLRWSAAFGWLPLLLATGGRIDTSWWHIAVLVAASTAAGVYELFRGGAGHGVAALVFELYAWLSLAELLGLPGDATVALLAAVALAWLLAGRFMGQPSSTELRAAAVHAMVFSRIVVVAAWLLMAGTTLALPSSAYSGWLESWTLPLSRAGAIVAFIAGAWALFARVGRVWPAAAVAALGSFISLALLVDGWFPGAHPAWVGCALVALAAAWLHLPRFAEWLAAPRLGRAVAKTAGGVLFFASAVMWLLARVDSGWPVIVLLGAVIALWVSEALRYRAPVFGVPVSFGLVMTATFAGDLIAVGPHVLGSALGAQAGAAVGVMLCAGAALHARLRPGASGACGVGWWAVPAACATTLASSWPAMMLIGPRYADVATPLAIAFALAAAAWALAAVATRVNWLLAAAAASGWVAIMAACASIVVPPCVTLAALSAYALALLSPTVLASRARSRQAEPLARTAAAPLAATAPMVAAGSVVLGIQSYVGSPLWAGWSELGPWGTAVAFVVLAAVLIVVSMFHRIELAEYLGALSIVAAGWVVLESAGTEILEPYLVLLALYIAGSSYRYASRASGRDVPLAADWAAVACAAWLPALLAMTASTPADALTHTVWSAALAIASIAAGITLKVRGYLFGGVAALLVVSVWRSFFLLVEFWWVALGVIGIAMLVVALTWERQQLLLVRTGRAVREYFGGWR